MSKNNGSIGIVKVIDDIMGSGKTSYTIQMMNEASISDNFIYVTPYRTEIERIQKEVKSRYIKTPDNIHGSGTLLKSLKRLVAQGEDIVTTHCLFSMADDELIQLLQQENYILIIDEVMEVVSTLQKLKKDDVPILLNSGYAEIDENKKVIWKAGYADTQYNEVRDYALAGNLYSVNDTAFVWNFPANVFRLFKEVYILTYMFDGQLQRSFYDLYSIEYSYYSIIREGGRYAIIPRIDKIEDRSKFKELIIIHGNYKLNDIGKEEHSLSKRWFQKKNNSDNIKQLQKNVSNYFRNRTESKSDDILWTTFKDYETKLRGKGYSKGFLSCNARATNDYANRHILAYCLNRYINPIITNFFRQYGIIVNEDLFALSELLQWIFRSAVRNGDQVQIYIPSKRMRTLLQKWIDNEI